jgi:sporulation protein YlmC with PRC-barrel domain
MSSKPSSGYASQPATNETKDLIASNKVEGTSVYNGSGEKLGSVYNLMVDKRSGKVAYAVMSFGGFLGMGSDYHPLPWEQLSYDRSKGGYVVNLSREQLEAAPTYSDTETAIWDDPAYGRKIDDYYAPFGGPHDPMLR